MLRTSFLSIATWLNSKQAGSVSEVAEGPQDMDTDSAASGPISNGAEASEQSTAQDDIIKKVMQELVFHSRAEVSCWSSSECKMGGAGRGGEGLSLRLCALCLINELRSAVRQAQDLRNVSWVREGHKG